MVTLWFIEKAAVFIGSWVALWLWTEWDRKRFDK